MYPTEQTTLKYVGHAKSQMVLWQLYDANNYSGEDQPFPPSGREMAHKATVVCFHSIMISEHSNNDYYKTQILMNRLYIHIKRKRKNEKK